MDEMNQYEVIRMTIEEFERLQNYMVLTEKDTPIYKAMKSRYNTLKVMLSSFGVNVTTLDIINE